MCIRDRACYDERLDQWVTLPGIYTIKIGFDSGNLPQSIELSVEGSVDDSPRSRELLKLDSHYSDIFEKMCIRDRLPSRWPR